MSVETRSGRRLLITKGIITEVVQCFPDLQEICIMGVPLGNNRPVVGHSCRASHSHIVLIYRLRIDLYQGCRTPAITEASLCCGYRFFYSALFTQNTVTSREHCKGLGSVETISSRSPQGQPIQRTQVLEVEGP